MHQNKITTQGLPLKEAKKALIMIHGRGAGAEDILSIATYLDVKDFALLAPEATGNTWYPYSFLTPPKENEPWLSSALELVGETVNKIVSSGISKENIFFLGFSQGACLTLEYVTRNAEKYGGVIAFTGGLIGDRIYEENYKGDFGETPVFIGTSDPDPHVPVERVNVTESILVKMNAMVTKRIYKNMGHTVNQDEIDWANKILGGIAFV
jgi:phospholipase/carboxylesterase